MRKIIWSLAGLVLFCKLACGGLIITAENDVWGGHNTDNNYSHGTELAWTTIGVTKDNELERRDFGFNQLMYTPSDITISTNCLSDRPWAGTLTVFYERWSQQGVELVRTRWSLGVLGPSALSEQSQTTIHKWIGSHKPEGWDNQLPDEPIVQYLYERHHPLYTLGKPEHINVALEGIYGGQLGTTFINGLAGSCVKLGWIPSSHMIGGIQPKVTSRERPFIYLVGQANGLCVLHNATLGDSYFHNQDAEERDLVPFVGEYFYGICTGYKSCSLTYLRADRSREFEGQPRTMDWGMIRLEFAVPF